MSPPFMRVLQTVLESNYVSSQTSYAETSRRTAVENQGSPQGLAVTSINS
jgi:hypothetical protein